MTMPPLQSWTVLPDQKMQAEADERAFELAYENFTNVREMMDDRISGFWAGAWKPKDRLALYERPGHLPILLAPSLTLDEFIAVLPHKSDPVAVQALLAPHVAVLVAMALTNPPPPTGDPMLDEPQLDAWMAEIERLETGGATLGDVLAPYWKRIWEWEPAECERLLRDYRRLFRARERNGGSLEDDMLLEDEAE